MTERHRRRSNQSTAVGFALPALEEIPLEPGLEPLLVTNAVGDLLPTRVSATRGCARYGFFDCPVSAEPELVPRFFSQLWEASRKSGWKNRCTSLSEASVRMQLQPRSVVVPYSLLEQVCGAAMSRADADLLMSAQGYIADADGRQILVGDLQPGQAIVAATPALVGTYTRIDDRLGIILTQVDRALMLVDEQGAA